MTLGAAMHRTSLEVINGEAIDTSANDMLVANTAEHGSAALQIAMERQFLRFSRKHHVTIADARLLCMNSWEQRR